MPSFDIVSRTALAEVDNAIQGAMREIGRPRPVSISRAATALSSEPAKTSLFTPTMT